MNAGVDTIRLWKNSWDDFVRSLGNIVDHLPNSQSWPSVSSFWQRLSFS